MVIIDLYPAEYFNKERMVSTRSSLTYVVHMKETLTPISRGSLSQSERKAYTDAVLCLQSKSAKTPASVAAGAKTRFDVR